MSLSNSLPYQTSYQTCECCGHAPLLPHELGWVCEVCGTVMEEEIFEQKQPIIRNRKATPDYYHSPAGFGTTIGTKKEAGNLKFNRMRMIDNDTHVHLNNSVRHLFLNHGALLDLIVPVDDLMKIFRKIFPQLPKNSHVKNLERLTFAILIRTMQKRGSLLTIKEACRKCGIEFKKVKRIFRALSQTTLNREFCPDSTDMAFHYLAKVQEKYEFQPEDISYITNIIRTERHKLGSTPKMLAAKAVILFLKARYLTRFFKRLQTTVIRDWIDLLQNLSSNKFRDHFTRGLGRVDIQVIAQDFGISFSEAYRCFYEMTWLKDRIIIDKKDEVVKFAWLRIPEWCFEHFFHIQARNPKVRPDVIKFETYNPIRVNLAEEIAKIQEKKRLIRQAKETSAQIKEEKNSRISSKDKSLKRHHKNYRFQEQPRIHNVVSAEISCTIDQLNLSALPYLINCGPYASMDHIPPPSNCAIAGVGPP